MPNVPLTKKACVPCRGGMPALPAEESARLLQELKTGWNMIQNHHLEKEWRFDDFKQALDFVNRVGALAEQEGHHPDVQLSWGKVKLTFWTHKIGGLTESDFIMAAKCDALKG